MKPIRIEKIYIILFSLIPASIVVGASVSLINILLISLIFLFFSIFNKNFEFLKNPIFLILISIYIYLIFNTFISLDAKMGISRNFGFIRFIIIFLAINYFIYLSKNIENVYKIWVLIISIVVIDSYIEFFFGKNILGYGGEDGPYQNRIVSFFKDEPVVGAYLNGFLYSDK